MKLDYCLHTHTKRCGHAVGEDEDYVVKAIEAGITTLGFSDHVMIPNVYQPTVRGSVEMIPDYINSVNNLKEKYKDTIDIKVGFECEYASHLKNYYSDLIKKYSLNYLICGQHFIFDKDNNPKSISGNLDGCVKEMCNAIKSGLFLYIAHPDIFVNHFYEWNETCQKYAEKICKTAVKYDVPLEINIHGRDFNKKTMLYANENFWKVAGKYGVKVVVGYDCHNPNDNYFKDLTFIDEWKQKYNLNLLTIDELMKSKNFINYRS